MSDGLIYKIANQSGFFSKGVELMNKMYDDYEPAGEDEEGAYNVTVTEDMTPDDVLNQVIKIIGKI